MAQRAEFREIVLSELERSFTLVKQDLGEDALLSKKGMTFETESWAIEGVGHLCIMRMHAFLGLMRMETAIIAPTCVDVPLFNLDWVKAFGIDTQIAELYDTQLSPWPDESQAKFEHISAQYADLPDVPSENAHWYDDILYPCSFHKKGKGVTERLSLAAQEYLVVFIGQLLATPACDALAKRAKVSMFAERLFAEGGPAVNQVTKLFGEQTAKRLILQHMYGVDLQA